MKKDDKESEPMGTTEEEKPVANETEQETEQLLAKKEAELNMHIDTLKRVQAEFENYRKRIDRDKEDFCSYAKKDLILKLLPVLDNFQLAIKADGSLKGAELIYSELLSILEKEGLKGIDTAGKKFDPHLHEALMQEKTDKEDGIILEEFQKGYTLHGKVIRSSKVKIGKKGGR